MEFVIYLALVLVGLCLGSFGGATVWRLRARQLAYDKKHGEKIDHDEYNKLKPLTKTTLMKDRSRCLHCRYELKWYDLIPLVSWITLGGRCRHCRKPIGYFEPIMELGTVAFFVLSYVFWPYSLHSTIDITHFVLWLLAGVSLAMLFAYDAKWFLLPDKLNIVVVAIGVVISVLDIIQATDHIGTVLSIIASVGVLSGLYLVLYLLSRGKWVGFGDVKLGLGLGLLLGDWQLAVVALFGANLIGSLVVIPGLVNGKLKPKSQVPFGPLLILGTIIAQLAGPMLVAWYSSTLV